MMLSNASWQRSLAFAQMSAAFAAHNDLNNGCLTRSFNAATPKGHPRILVTEPLFPGASGRRQKAYGTDDGRRWSARRRASHAD
jgi:hypothetical protein